MCLEEILRGGLNRANNTVMANKHRLDLPLLLPDVPHAGDDCVQRLLSNLEPREGIERVHVMEGHNSEPAKLCIHYDPDILPLPRIRQIARSIGAEITDQFGHIVWHVEGVRHPRHARTIASRLRTREGIMEADVSAAGQIRVEFDRSILEEEELGGYLRTMGLRPDVEQRTDRGTADAHRPESGRRKKESAVRDTSEHRRDHHDHAHGGLRGDRSELIFALIAGGLLGIGFAAAYVSAIPSGVSLALYVLAYVFGGYYTVVDVVENIRAGRFEVDFLMLFAAAGAAVLGEWVEGAFLLFLFSTGHALEHYAMERARTAIESLADLAPETARVRRDGQEQEVAVEDLSPGDVVLIRANDRIPADGIVVEGQSQVDESPVTGESVPVDKRPVEQPDRVDEGKDAVDPVHRVFAGTINGTGFLEVQVTRRSDESTLARVITMVREAETATSPTQRFTDRFERHFVPAVFGLVGLLLFAWIPLEETFTDSFYRALAVLVAASPCALAIATPSAVLSGVARAARGGVLVKGGGPLENLGNLTALAFDKTGTLTEGDARVTDLWAVDGVSEDELLHVAVAVEQLSDHPLAEAVVQYGSARLNGRESPAARNSESIAGRGMRATIDGEPVYIGKDALFEEIDGPPLPEEVRAKIDAWESDGRTTVIVRRGDRYLGVIGLMDTPRSEAAGIIERLRRIGVRQLVMISGDNQSVTEAIARQVGIDEARGDLLPDDKVATIKSLHRQGKVAMVGDGVNDAPAMAHATVGIAMGAAGSDVALETADVALMADRLDRLPFVVGLSRETSRVIRQNLWISLGMVAFLVPATILGLSIGPAVLLHEGSTLLVVLNALRLLTYEPDE